MRVEDDKFIFSATDLGHYLACNHLNQLSRKVALKELKKPYFDDPALAILIKRGEAHEAAYVEHLKRSGKLVINLRGKPYDATVEAMKKGYDVIVQAKLEKEHWMGYSDILYKVPDHSAMGNWSYEVQDTKLSQQTRPEAILQLCLYSEIIERIQGTPPESMQVVTPGNPFHLVSYRFADFRAYFNLIKKSLESAIENPVETYPDPVEHCNICTWWQVCNQKRHLDDHLSLVAGLRKTNIDDLVDQGITTLEAFAQATTLQKPARGNFDTLTRKQDQAKIQLKGRINNQGILHEMLDIEPDRGLNRLPEPTAGDIYFDIEGDPFFENGGLEYLLGYVYKDHHQIWMYEKLWAKNQREEKITFEIFIGFVIERLKTFPALCIYHYAPYEPSTMKRLMHKHATRETEVDALIRGLRFVDLHAIVKETLLASVERYSLKDVEQLPKFVRNVPLHDAGLARRTVECALELNEIEKLPVETLETVVGYNEDDCRATLALHLWLEEQRKAEIQSGEMLQRLAINDGEANDNVQEQDTRSRSLFDGLTANLPEDHDTWTPEDRAKWLLAHQLDYFRREDKSAWWEYFRLHELTDNEDLLDERKAITGLKFMVALPLKGKERIPVHRYTFPVQEISISEKAELIEVMGDTIGKVEALSEDDCTIDIKKMTKSVDIHPTSVHTKERVNPGPMVTSIMNLAESIVEDGMTPAFGYHAAKDLLLKNKPRLQESTGQKLLLEGEDIVSGAIRLALHLNKSVLPIQGPPGSGKTYVGARMIIALSKAGKRVGVTAVSHKVIRNLFDKILGFSKDENLKIQLVHKPKELSTDLPDGLEEVGNDKDALAALDQKKVVGGTAWLWSANDAREKLDYLFVDEAGQMSLTQVLAASQAAKNLILLGDPQQLEQPQRGAHPEGSDVAALTYLLDGHKTMPEDRGLFLKNTWRLCPAICAFTSELFYEGRLAPITESEKKKLSGNTHFDGAGLFYVPVAHHSNQHKSKQEVDVIKSIVNELIQKGHWTNGANETRPITQEDILIVAPYNAQVAALKTSLPDSRIGTVDKFQGQEAAVVIYSMTCSTAEDAPRGMSFLYNPNRFNVATSRAMCACILVASPKLLEPECKSIDQMKWANAVCRFGEMSVTVRP